MQDNRVCLLLGDDAPLVDELSRTTEQATPTGNIRYYPPDGMEHRTDMVRATVAAIQRLSDIEEYDSDSDWMDGVELIGANSYDATARYDTTDYSGLGRRDILH